MRTFFIFSLICCCLICRAQTLNPPVFSHEGGFYALPFSLTLAPAQGGDTVYYTLDGSEPDRGSAVYSAPLQIQSRTGDTNVLSVIPTNFVQTGAWAYEVPQAEVFKATVVRARSYSGSSTPSVILTHTYFVDTLMSSRYQLPVVSLATAPENLFSDSSGLYVPGISYTGSDNTGNYFETGSSWERPLHFEYFTAGGLRSYATDATVRIHGGDTRLLPQKALRLYAGTFFNYPFFPDKDISSFKTLMLRNSGNDNTHTMFRDVFMSELARDMGSGLEYQSGFPVVVFIDGEFWGIHNLRERTDKYYIGSNGGTDPDNIDYLEKHGVVKEGDNLHYFQWYNYLETADMTLQAGYDYMKGMIDIADFIDYNIAQLYFANIDWPSNNRDYWRPRTAGGLWRWIIFDTDFGFGLESYNNYDNNTLVFATTPNGPTSPPAWNTNYPFATMQLRKMLQNSTFRNDFINRFADMLNTLFRSDTVTNRINSFEQRYATAMPEHIARWSKPQDMAGWHSNIEQLRSFAQNRPAYMRKYIMEYFNGTEPLSQDINDTSNITVTVNDSLMGHVVLSTIRPPAYPWSGVYFHAVPVPLKAKARTGYRFVAWAGTGITAPEIHVILQGDTTFTAVFEADPNYTPKLIFINEFMASNTSGLQDEYGEQDDWIEIFNPGYDTLDLAGFYITDDMSHPQKHQFVTGSTTTQIPPEGFVVLWADGTPAQGPLHLGFKLSGTGEAIALYDSTLTLIDAITFGTQSDNVSYGRFPDGYNNWHFFSIPTPGEPNSITSTPCTSATSTPLLYPNPTHGIIYLSSEASSIEIYNMLGQLILTHTQTSFINLEGLDKGVYFAGLNKKVIIKVIKY